MRSVRMKRANCGGKDPAATLRARKLQRTRLTMDDRV
jgi:hypothetical protein